MRSFLQFALLAPVLVAGIAIPPSHDADTEVKWGVEDAIVSSDSSHAVVEFKAPQELAIAGDRLSFQLQVLESEAPCGFGNITLDGQVLPQTLGGSISTGEGSLSTEHDNIVAASWSFQCIQVDGQPDAQLLTFIIDSVDGKAIENAGFSVMFTQTKNPSIIGSFSDSSNSGFVDPEDFRRHSLDDDLAELDYMEAQLRELKHLIHEKKLAIAERTGHFDNSITKCDSLKCVATTIGGKAQEAANNIIAKVKGSPETEEFPKLRWPRPPFHHGKPGNHTCGPPKHGKGNHTHPHPPPHFRKPRLPLPICRYPPPPHREPGHKRPPHHEPPFHRRPDDHPPHHDPPHHGEPPKDKPDHRKPSPPDHRAAQGILQFSNEDEATSSASPYNDQTPEFVTHRHKRAPKVIHVLGLGISVFLLTLLFKSLHRRCSTPSKKAARQTRRAERQHRRSLRRAAHKQAINNFLTRLGCQLSHTQSQQDEEKRAALLADNDDSASTTMTEDLAEFRNAAEMVSDIIAAEEGMPRTRASLPMSRRQSGRRRFYAGESESEGEEELLPAYEDSESTDMGSVVDGCRYTPGSSDYTPSQAGSASDILGPDTKQ